MTITARLDKTTPVFRPPARGPCPSFLGLLGVLCPAVAFCLGFLASAALLLGSLVLRGLPGPLAVVPLVFLALALGSLALGLLLGLLGFGLVALGGSVPLVFSSGPPSAVVLGLDLPTKLCSLLRKLCAGSGTSHQFLK